MGGIACRQRSLESASRAAGDRRGMMIDRAAATGLPRHDERIRHAASAADERPGQGRGNPGVAPSDHSAGAPTGQAEGALQRESSGVPGGAAAPAATEPAGQAAVAGAPRDGSALASQPTRTPPRGCLPTQAPGPAADRALDSGPGVAPGPGEPQLGISPAPRRTARPRNQGSRVHRVGDLEGGRDRPGARAHVQHVGRLPTLPGRRPAGLRLPGNGHPYRNANVRVRGDRARHPAGSGSWAPPRTRRHRGWCRPRRTRSWTSKTPATGHGS